MRGKNSCHELIPNSCIYSYILSGGHVLFGTRTTECGAGSIPDGGGIFVHCMGSLPT